MTIDELIEMGEKISAPDSQYSEWLYELKDFFSAKKLSDDVKNTDTALLFGNSNYRFIEYRNKFLGRLRQLNKKKGNNSIMKKNIFIVHGHDNEMKESVARFIEKLGFKPIILNEQANQGKTIIEKLESQSKEAQYAIILYTADDVGMKRSDDKNENELSYRARQNVIFEHGFFTGILGRNNVALIYENGIELPSDVTGIVYTDKNSWQTNLAKELKTTGFDVDMNKIL